MERIVLKVGSAVLSEGGEIAHERLDNLVRFIVKLKEKYEVILVSSGSVAAGYTVLPLDKSDTANKQTLAAIGQPLLMRTYNAEFKKYGIIPAQILLEASIFKDDRRLPNAKNAINNMLNNNVLPIVNENDVTAIEELVFGDNDQLAAYVTKYFDASMLVILTDIEGYYDKNPKEYSDAKHQKVVTYIPPEDLEQATSANSEFATGGIVTKLKAADFLMKNNLQMFLTSGFRLKHVEFFLLKDNHIKGTLFING